MDKIVFGQRLRQIRQEKGYTLQSLAGKAGIGNVYLSEPEDAKPEQFYSDR